MIEKSLMVIIFLYIASFSAIGMQYIADSYNITITNQKGEIVFIINKEDAKVRKLTSLLSEKKVLTPTEAQNIMSMEPFPRMNI